MNTTLPLKFSSLYKTPCSRILFSLNKRTYTGRTLHPKKIAFPPDFQTQFGSYDRIYPARIYTSKPIPRKPSVELVPSNVSRPAYANLGIPLFKTTGIPKLQHKELDKMKVACQLAADTLLYAKSLVVPGVSTLELDTKIRRFIINKNAYPSPLNYAGFPKSICTSINNIIAHGIPDNRLLIEGDIINIDITVFINGYHGDTSATFMVGQVDEKGKDLLHHTKYVLAEAIRLCGPGARFSSIGNFIEPYGIQNGYTTNNIFSGHGIGTSFHQNPLIYHFENDEPGIMEVGNVFTIEPMFNQGSKDTVFYPDGWTVSTKDGGRSAQFEHTIIITDNGAEILTK
ncbi:hypothetical protein BB561_004019 [Smittium simulii]|uniref:Methionine aminopeptidase n=1 Tax=Smittium simulii TaxID=133385 RepID=A0A2T9YII7_9FUNG|nr:hypothetical protein BB561_004019 [Smittium simulii]